MCDNLNNTASIQLKINFFMQKHILPFFDPKKIKWWFSISGGKDSFSMTHLITDWYNQNNIPINAEAFIIRQWNDIEIETLISQFNWIKVKIIDARKKTKEHLNYVFGEQAPCRACSDIRRDYTDLLLNENRNNFTNIVCRGLHLSDTAVSILWRYLLEINPIHDMKAKNKSLPLTHLYKNVYLAKPLFYMREYESYTYSKSRNYQPICCKCPGCLFPSRRDIIEETAVKSYPSLTWEFSIPYIKQFLDRFITNTEFEILKNLTLKGVQQKKNHIPQIFFDFIVNLYAKKNNELSKYDLKFDSKIKLDQIGFLKLKNKSYSYSITEKFPIPGILLDPDYINDNTKYLITILGPFWGKIGLNKYNRKVINNIYNNEFNLHIDYKFSHVNKLLNYFYGKDSLNEFTRTKDCICYMD